MHHGLRFLHAGSLLVAASVVSLFACGSETEPSEETSAGPAEVVADVLASSATIARRQQRTAAPGQNVKISVEAPPNASCVLHAQADAEAKNGMRLLSGAQGVVSFFVNRTPPAGAVDRLALDCGTANGAVETFPIEITTELELRADRAQEPASPRVLGRHRPALSGDLARPTQDELRAQHYPLRPDPARSPQAYELWLAAVTHDATVLEPEVIKVPGVRHDFQLIGSDNWAGVIADNSVAGGQFTDVAGAWTVPTVSATPGMWTYSSAWIGLDGGGGSSADILQNGTAHNMQDLTIFFGYPYYVSEYYAWAQYLPGPSVRMNNFAIAPGHVVLFETWVCEASGALNPNGGYACYYFENGTTHVVITHAIARPSGAPPFTGDTAEWLVERQLVDGNVPPLANFGQISMPLTLALHSSWGMGGYASFGSVTAVEMYNGSKLLAWPTGSASNPIGVDFHWADSL